MTTLKQGDQLGPFAAYLQDGSPFTDDDLKDKKYVILFYPKDNTPTCSIEVCAIRDGASAIRDLGYEVYGVSADSQRKHQNFIRKFDLNFDLVSDPERSVISAFDVWHQKKFMGRTFMGIVRTTFIIHPNNTVVDVITKVKAKSHAEQVLEHIAALV